MLTLEEIRAKLPEAGVIQLSKDATNILIVNENFVSLQDVSSIDKALHNLGMKYVIVMVAGPVSEAVALLTAKKE